MKRLAVVLLVAVLLLTVGGSVFAKGWDYWMPKKSMAVSGTVGIAFPFGVALYPGFEWMFANWKAGNAVPFSFGVAARAMLDFDTLYGFEFGIGPALTMHLGLKGLDLPSFLQKFDFYWGVGIGFVFPTRVFFFSPVGVFPMAGFNWFINNKWALKLEGTYFAWYGGVSIGAQYKI